MSVFKYFSYLSLCQKLEKSNEQFLRKILNWWTDQQRDVWTDRQRDNGNFIV